MGRKNVVMQLALATLIGMPLIALLIDRFSDTVDMRISVVGFVPIWQQVLIGIGSGLAFAYSAKWLIGTSFMQKVNDNYANILGRFNFSASEIFFISLCAGVGEEMLFRGALQPLLGMVITSIFFVAIHGYLNPKNLRLSVYGLFMTGIIFIISWMAEKFGLIPAIIAHTIIDIVLMFQMQASAASLPAASDDDGQDHFIQ